MNRAEKELIQEKALETYIKIKIKEMEELRELILAEAPESIWYNGQDNLWYVDTGWLGRDVGSLFEGEDVFECLEKMHKYLLEHMDDDDTEGMIITKSGYPDLAKVRIYLKNKREEEEFIENMIEEKDLNLVEILKDAPKGTKLYSPIFGEVKFLELRINHPYPIEVECTNSNGSKFFEKFTKIGTFYTTYEDSECLLFPSKENRDWSTFKIEKEKESIKVGDYLKQKGSGDLYKVTDIDEVGNKLCYLKKLIYNGTTEDRQLTGYYEEEIWEYFEKATKFDPNSLKPFDCVLVRDRCKWHISHFQEISKGVYRVENGMLFDVCIPYNEDTKHLLGTEKEEPEFYKL